MLVASSAPLDQFIVQHPDYFFGSSPEHAYIQPDNLEILVNHLKCAAFELPISPDEHFGDVDLPDALRAAGGSGVSASQWRRLALGAGGLSGGHDQPALGHLRQFRHHRYRRREDHGKPEVIGEVDFSSALTTVHPKAIYIHQGQQYHVERLDFEQRKAYVKPVNVDYFTDAIRYTQVRVLEIAEEADASLVRQLARAWRCAGAIAGRRLQENQVLHQ